MTHRIPQNSYSPSPCHSPIKIARASTTIAEDINTVTYIPHMNESVSVCTKRVYPAERLLQTVCSEHGLDLERYTLEHQDGSCVELDVSLMKYYESLGGRTLQFNMVQKGRIYKSMAFYKDNVKILTTSSSDGVVQVSSALPQVLVDMFVNSTSSSKSLDMEYIRTLILTYRSYTTSEEFFDSIVSTVPELGHSAGRCRHSSAGSDHLKSATCIKDKISEFEAMSSSSATKYTSCSAPVRRESNCGGNFKDDNVNISSEELERLNLNSRLDDALDMSVELMDSLSVASGNIKTASSIGAFSKTCKDDTASTFAESCTIDIPLERSFKILREIIPDCETRMRNILALIKIWLDLYYFDFYMCSALKDKLRQLLSDLKVFMHGTFNSDAEDLMILLKDRVGSAVILFFSY